MPSNILIVEAPYYQDIADELARGAAAALEEAGAAYDRLEVPGALEIPGAISIASGASYDGFVALGCVIRGETSHYDIVAGESARAIMDLTTRDMDCGGPLAIGNGILTVDNREQAWARAAVAEKNKGADAARACLALIELKDRFLGSAGLGR